MYEDAYKRGFETKCAAFGIDPQALVKQAQGFEPPPELTSMSPENWARYEAAMARQNSAGGRAQRQAYNRHLVTSKRQVPTLGVQAGTVTGRVDKPVGRAATITPTRRPRMAPPVSPHVDPENPSYVPKVYPYGRDAGGQAYTEPQKPKSVGTGPALASSSSSDSDSKT